MATPHNFGDFMRTLSAVVRAKFGPGVLGRLGTVAIGAIVVLGVVSIPLAFVNPSFAMVPIGGIIVVTLLFFFQGFSYATKFPEISAMDGAQVARILTSPDAAMKIGPGSPPIEITGRVVENPLLAEARAKLGNLQPESERGDVDV